MPGELRPYGDIPMSRQQVFSTTAKAPRQESLPNLKGTNRLLPARGKRPTNAARSGSPQDAPVPESIFVDAVEQVVEANKHWVPLSVKRHVRPPAFDGQRARAGRSPHRPTFLIITPVGLHFKGGMSAIDLLISEHHHRAAPGGSGGVKAIGNYAPGMKPSKEAKAKGYAEVIYLDAETHTVIEEVGAANFFCVKDVCSTPRNHRHHPPRHHA